MPVVLRAYGEHFDVDGFLVESALNCFVCGISRRGEPKFPASQPDGPVRTRSNLNITVSDADFHEFDKQIFAATSFLRIATDEIERLRQWPGVEGIEFDFGIERLDVAIQSDCFPPELVQLAGKYGLGLVLSQYWPMPKDDEGEEQNTTCQDSSASNTL
jgi:hypothetical protein